MKENKILELEKRRQIYNLIVKYPGLHIREISRKINIPFTTSRHHLNYLEKHDFIITKKDGRHYRFYAKYKIDRRDKKIIDILRKKTPREMVLLLLAFVECSQTEISQNLEKHPSTISFHLKKMQDMDIVEKAEVNKGKIYKEKLPIIKREIVTNETIFMLKDPYRVYYLLMKYKDSFYGNTKFSFVLDYVNLFLSEGIPDKILSSDSSIDSVEQFVYKILFPPPFCA